MKRLIGAILILIVLGTYWGCQAAYPSGTLRYRLTVEAVANGQPVTGSGVIEVTYTAQPVIGGVTSRLKGEAIRLDFGSRGSVFLLLIEDRTRSESLEPSFMVVEEFNLAPSQGSLSSETLRSLSSLEAKVEMPLDHLPMIVYFRDTNKPTSAEVVEYDALFHFLGEGTHLERATIETTDDSITTGIDEILPWLSKEESLREFYRAFLDKGFRPNGSIEIRTLFKRG